MQNLYQCSGVWLLIARVIIWCGIRDMVCQCALLVSLLIARAIVGYEIRDTGYGEWFNAEAVPVRFPFFFSPRASTEGWLNAEYTTTRSFSVLGA